MRSVNEAAFPDVMRSSRPHVVTFSAPWCAPCKTLKSMLEKVEQRVGSDVEFVSMDVTQNTGLATHMQVRTVPTVMFIHGGQVVDRVVGALSQGKFEEKMNAAFGISE